MIRDLIAYKAVFFQAAVGHAKAAELIFRNIHNAAYALNDMNRRMGKIMAQGAFQRTGGIAFEGDKPHIGQQAGPVKPSGLAELVIPHADETKKAPGQIVFSAFFILQIITVLLPCAIQDVYELMVEKIKEIPQRVGVILMLGHML